MQQDQTPFLKVINEILSHLNYSPNIGALYYRFEKSIELTHEVLFEKQLYYWIHWIDEVSFNLQTRKLKYICSSTDSQIVQSIPVNNLSPEILQIVYKRMKSETQK